jgi:predicted phosphoribosyltransferase
MVDFTGMAPFFRDRTEAGCKLAEKVKPLVQGSNVVVAVLPRGGVPVGFEVAQALKAQMDVLVVRKLGVPGQKELAFGAIAGGQQFIDHALVASLQLTPEEVARVVEQEARELRGKEELYRAHRSPVSFDTRTVILVDDGMATGSTMSVAVQTARQAGAAWIIVAVPVASATALQQCRMEADECVCLATPAQFRAVSEWYEDFSPVSDAEARLLLASV